MSKTIFMVACEASGDSHGAHLIENLRSKNPNLQFVGLGGNLMQKTGMTILEDLTKVSALGFGDVLKNYFYYKKVFDFTVREIKQRKPDLLVVMDSPAFNLRLAKKVSSICPIVYYISPQLWAWGKNRVSVVQKHISKMLCILPFEKDFYEEHKVDAEYIGHPLMQKIPAENEYSIAREILNIPTSQPAIGIFPGSRSKEVKRILPIMLDTANRLQSKNSEIVFYLKRSENIKSEVYDEIISNYSLNIKEPPKDFYTLVQAMDFALVTSGTATLETALLGTPFILLYKAAASTYFIGKHLVKVKYLGLANLLLDKPVIPEFIQNDAQPEAIADCVEEYLSHPEKLNGMKSEFKKLREILGNKNAEENASEIIFKMLND